MFMSLLGLIGKMRILHYMSSVPQVMVIIHADMAKQAHHLDYTCSLNFILSVLHLTELSE